MSNQHFPIRIGRRSRRFLRVVFGVKPDEARVEIFDGDFAARFGYAHLRTPLANIVSWRIEGPWRWITAIGVRRSIRHGDITFGGSPHGGVRVDFRQPVRIGWMSAPALYVTVDDLEGLAAALTAAGISGQDARRPGARS